MMVFVMVSRLRCSCDFCKNVLVCNVAWAAITCEVGASLVENKCEADEGRLGGKNRDRFVCESSCDYFDYATR